MELNNLKNSLFKRNHFNSHDKPRLLYLNKAKMKTFETLSETMEYLKGSGYIHDFNLHPDWIECPPLKLKLAPDQFHVDQVHRFEGITSSADDSAILFAVSSSNGVKGLLVDAYGPYAESLSTIMIQKLTIDNRTNLPDR